MVQSVVDLFQQLARNEFGFFARLRSISEIMSTQVPTVNSDCSVGDVIGRRDPATIGSIAVLDSEKHDLIGLLKQSTVLRCLPRYVNTLKEADRDRHILATNVCDLVTRQTPSLPTTATPLEALEIMVGKNCDCILVYDDPHHLKGIVTPVNFACTMLLYYRVFHQISPLQRLRLVDLDSELSLDEIFCRGAQTARDVMSPPIAISGREPVATAITMMKDNDVQFLPLLNEDNQVVGVVSENDILTALQPPSRLTMLTQSAALPCMVDLLASGQEPTLAEPVSSVAKGRLMTVQPTSRLSETLTQLVETGRDAVVVQNEGQLLGIVTLKDVTRVFRTLMRLQSIKDK
jgi:CBS-domain-containing membrane protein